MILDETKKYKVVRHFDLHHSVLVMQIYYVFMYTSAVANGVMLHYSYDMIFITNLKLENINQCKILCNV
jgi:hypothetical protein